MARLGDVFSVIRNGASIKQTDGAGGLPITRIETISNREIDRNKFGYAGIKDIDKYHEYILQDGDILMSHINSEKHLGKVALYKKQGNEIIIHGMNLLMLRANEALVYPPFAAYYFETNMFLNQIQRITKKSVNQASFTVTALKEIEMPLLSLEEQRRIAALLDKVSDLIAKRRAQLDKLDLLVKSRFVEMFGDPVDNPYGWDVVNLTNFGECKNGMNFHTDDSGAEIHCLGVGDFKDLSIIEDTSKLPTISLKKMPSDDYLLADGDIVFVRSNGNKALVGRSVAVYPKDIPTTFSGFCIRFRIQNSTILPSYLLRVLKTDSMRKKMAGRGVNIQNLNQKILAELSVPVPSLALQKEFELFVQKVEKSKLIIQKSLDKLETLKKALMQQYFR